MKSQQLCDKQLVILIALLVGAGTVILFSASSFFAWQKYNDNMYFLKRHLIFLFIGVISAYIFSKFNYKNWKVLAFPLILISIILLIVGFIASPAGESARWLIYANGKKMITISDLARVALIIFTAHYFDKNHKNIRDLKNGFIPYLTVAGLFMILIASQKDFSTAAVMFAFTTIMMFIGKVKFKYLSLFVLIIGISGYYYFSDNEYMQDRFEAYKNQEQDLLDSNFQINNAKLGISTGGLFGLGVGDGKMKEGFLPLAYNDFIFSVIGEELGLVWTTVLMSLFLLLFLKGIQIAKQAPNMFAIFLSIGIVLNIALYFIINVGYSTGLLPATGLPLPFISYGGSHTVCTLASIGILLNISREVKIGENRWGRHA